MQATSMSAAPADICIFDPARYWRVEPPALKSQGKNTPFVGLEVCGKVIMTIVAGTSSTRRRRPRQRDALK